MVATNEVDETFLGILLHNGDYIYNIIDKVTPQMLDGEPNQVIYRYMVRLAKNGIDISRVLLKNELLKDGVYTSVGGDGYIDYLMIKGNNVGDSLSAYVDEVVENYKRRELIRFAVRLQKLANQDSTSTISRASKFLNQLSVTGGNTEDVVLLGDVIDTSLERIVERSKNPGIQGITTGFSKLDKHTTGYGPGEMWFIGARPSMGKTAFLLKSLLSTAKSGNPALLINREMYIGNLTERLLSMESGISHTRIRDGNLTQDELSLLTIVKNNLKQYPLYIDNNWTGTETYVLATIRKYYQLHGIKVVGIDYIQLLVERSEESTHELGRLSRNIKLTTGELGITAVVLSQLNRKLEERQDKRPQMYDLRQAGYLEEDGDYMIGMYRDEVYRANSPDAGKVEFIIRKARNASLGTITLGFAQETVNIYDDDDLPILR